MQLAIELVSGPPLQLTSRQKCKRFSKCLFLVLHYPLSWANIFCNGKGKRHPLTAIVEGPWQRNAILIYFYSFWSFFSGQFFFIVTKKEGKKTGRRSRMKIIPKTVLFGRILNKSAHSFCSAWSILLATFGLHLFRGPKALKLHFSRNRTTEVWPRKNNLWHGQLHGPWCKQPLIKLNLLRGEQWVCLNLLYERNTEPFRGQRQPVAPQPSLSLTLAVPSFGHPPAHPPGWTFIPSRLLSNLGFTLGKPTRPPGDHIQTD